MTTLFQNTQRLLKQTQIKLDEAQDRIRAHIALTHTDAPKWMYLEVRRLRSECALIAAEIDVVGGVSRTE